MNKQQQVEVKIQKYLNSTFGEEVFFDTKVYFTGLTGVDSVKLSKAPCGGVKTIVKTIENVCGAVIKSVHITPKGVEYDAEEIAQHISYAKNWKAVKTLKALKVLYKENWPTSVPLREAITISC